jgi:hypothetical protein
VSCLDALVGDVEDSLRAAGLWHGALLVFASDNGPEGALPAAGAAGASAHPLRGRKRTVWEGGVRVPAFVHCPHPLRLSPHALPRSRSPSGFGGHGLGHARAFTGLFHFVDWAPTLLAAAADLLGMPPDDDWGDGDGSSSSSSSSSSSGNSSQSERPTERWLGGGPLRAGGRFPGWPYDGGPVADPLGQVANGVSAWAAISGRGPVAEHRTEALLQFEPIARCGALRRRNLKFVWNGAL